MWILVHFIYCCTTAVIIINITLLAAKVLLLRSVPNLSFQVPQLLQLTGGRSIADSCRNSRAGTCLCKSWPTKSPTPSGLGASFPLPDVHYMTWACQEKTRSPAVPLGKCQTPGTTCTLPAEVRTSSSYFLTFSIEGWHGLEKNTVAKHQCIFISFSWHSIRLCMTSSHWQQIEWMLVCTDIQASSQCIRHGSPSHKKIFSKKEHSPVIYISLPKLN